MRLSGQSAVILLVLALGLAACGGSSGGSSKSGSGSPAEYTKVTNDAAGEFAAVNDQISSAASGGQADTTAAWTALADRVDRVAVSLKATKAPTTESQAPLAALTRDVTKLGGDVRAIATAGGAGSAAAKLVNALSHDGEVVQADLQKLPLY